MKKLILVFVFFLSNMSVNAENKNKDTHTATSLSDSVTDNSLVGSGMQEVVVTGQYTPISADKAIHKNTHYWQREDRCYECTKSERCIE